MANDAPTLTLLRSRGREIRGTASGASPRPSNTASAASMRHLDKCSQHG